MWDSSGPEVRAGLALLVLGTVTDACVVSGAVLLVISMRLSILKTLGKTKDRKFSKEVVT